MAGQEATYLEGRINVMEEQMVSINEKIDVLLRKSDESAEILTQLRIEGAHRSAAMDTIRAENDGTRDALEQHIRREESLIASLSDMVKDPRRGALSDASGDDGLPLWRRRAIDGLVVAVCIVGILLLITLANKTLLNKDAIQSEHSIMKG